MTRGQIALRWTAYAAVALVGMRWLWSALTHLRQPVFGTDMLMAGDGLRMFAKLSGYGAQGSYRFTVLVLSVKLFVGALLLLTSASVFFGGASQQRHHDDRRDRALMLSVFFLMLMAAPMLWVGRVMPGVVDDLTLIVLGITCAALSRPEFVGDAPPRPA